MPANSADKGSFNSFTVQLKACIKPGQTFTHDRFNSFTVQLKVNVTHRFYNVIRQFQFIYCAIKRVHKAYKARQVQSFNSFTVQLKER